MNFKTHYNSKPDRGEINNDPSVTIPDQNLTLREILTRHSNGSPITGQRTPLYYGEDLDTPDFDKLDLSDKEELRKQIKEELKELNGKFTKAQAEEAQKKKIQNMREELAAFDLANPAPLSGAEPDPQKEPK